MGDTSSRVLRWAVLGAGKIGRTFAQALPRSRTGRLVAVASRSQPTADAFADEFGLPPEARHASYDALLKDRRVDAVYLATPHPMHARWAVQCLEAGKHVLCEKPMTLNAGEARTVVAAAERSGRFLMEAFMYRCHPQIARFVQLVREGAIGELRSIDAAFSFNTGKVWPQSRLYDPALGGGSILDVGCYAMSFARLAAGAGAGRPFLDPVEVKGAATLCDTGVDAAAAAALRFDTGVVARLACGMLARERNEASVYGSTGSITLHTPWIPPRDGGRVAMTLRRDGHDDQFIEIDTDTPLYVFEIDAFGDAVVQGRQQPHPPAMTWDDSLGNMAALDAWRASVGLVYPQER